MAKSLPGVSPKPRFCSNLDSTERGGTETETYRWFSPPKPASLRDAGFATLEVALGLASPCPCVAL